jgi:DNA-3-methyladenine glycosylase I
VNGLIRQGRVTRCWWCGDHEDYRAYHDEEWGRPVADDRLLFEKMSLEGFQSGLSWLTILRKRENFRRAFAGFDWKKVARFDEAKVEELLQDAGIVRHRGKIEAVIHNARLMGDLVAEHGSFAKFVWGYEPGPGQRPERVDYDTLMNLARTPESGALAKALKKRGFRFFGPTTAYAFMQAMGLVNDHLAGCSTRRKVEEERRAFRRP